VCKHYTHTQVHTYTIKPFIKSSTSLSTTKTTTTGDPTVQSVIADIASAIKIQQLEHVSE
jgi:hypothetical protein